MLKTIFLTFASNSTGPGKYGGIQSAAKRLASQAETTGQFISSVVVGWDDIEKFMHTNSISIPVDPHRYFFKPLLTRMAISGYFGQADIYFYADAGCEIVNNRFAKADFKKMIKNVNKEGIYAEGTRYKDISWCKYELIKLLNSPDSHLDSGQVQSTFFLISNDLKNVDRVNNLIDEWVSLALRSDGLYLGDLYDVKKQSELFISPRYDQSLFSLLLKKHNFRIFREKRRGFGKFKNLRGSNTFLHTSRNRTGISQLPKYINNISIGFLTFMIRPILTFHDFFSDKYGIRNQYNDFDPKTIASESGWQQH